MTRRTISIGQDWFDSLYATDPDPWRFASSDYERDKYAASLAILPKPRFEAALEVGCSIGIFTRQLAARCERLLALDVADTALTQARQNCSAANVTFANACVPRDWPQGRFDLIILSEILYYLDAADLLKVAKLASGALLTNGAILLVHYLGDTDYPLTGDVAAETFIVGANIPLVHTQRAEHYRIDLLASAH